MRKDSPREDLSALDGVLLRKNCLEKDRRKKKIYRRLSTLQPRKTAEELVELLNIEFKKGGILGYGWVHLATYFFINKEMSFLNTVNP
jgi:hypothetical protein